MVLKKNILGLKNQNNTNVLFKRISGGKNIIKKKMKKTILAFSIILTVLVSCKSSRTKTSEVIEETFFSSSLNEERKLKIYFPKEFDSKKKYPVVYATDGQLIVEGYKKELDSYINDGTLTPLIIVGVYSNEKEVKNTVFEYRNFEYLRGLGDGSELNDLYHKHRIFFLDEVKEYIESKYHISSSSRIFYGFSNGADFGYEILLNNCSDFDSYLLYSLTGSNRKQGDKYEKKCKSKVFISYGTSENESLRENLLRIEDSLKTNKYHVQIEEYMGGHNRTDWKKQFFKDMLKINRNKEY